MLVRDEDDIIEQCLEHLLTWIDVAYILDLGSTDRTWEIVQEFASRDRRIVPVESSPYVFNNSLRGYVFEKFRYQFKERDWVLRLDADEFYHIAPPEFVRERLSVGETCVYLGWYFFRLTSRECDDYEKGRVDVFKDRMRSITERRRYFKLTEHTEPRMFRYRASMKWTPTGSFPLHAGYVARERIPIRHYPHRDPPQMEKRYALRTKMLRLDSEVFPQWKLDDWRKEVIDFDPISMSSKERTAVGEGLSATPGHNTGPLHVWKHETALPRITGSSHLSPYAKRLVQRTIHSPVISIIDHFRSGWPPSTEPHLLDQP
jgi:glycosyltransferase involved in cell wall biosynthesis